MSHTTLRWLFAGCKVCSMVALGIAASAFLGHVTHVSRLYTWGGDGTMSLPTAVYAIMLAAVSFFLSYGMRELERQTRQAKSSRKKLA